jgi:hypothetical protein
MKVKSVTIATLAVLSVLVSIRSFARNPFVSAAGLAPVEWNMQVSCCPGGPPCSLTDKGKQTKKEEKAEKKTAKRKAEKKEKKEKKAENKEEKRDDMPK